MIADKTDRIIELEKNHWVNYPASIQTIRELNQLLEFNRSHRPQSLLLISESNNGKTIIAKRFVAAHPPRVIETEEGFEKIVMDVFMVQCPHIPDEKLLYRNILDKLNIVYRASSHAHELLSIVLDAFRRLELRILVLDELQHIFGKASPNKQREFLNLIKYISNEVEISIVGVGTREAFYVINSDPQLANRFNKSVIPKWKFDNTFLSLLATYQAFIKLEKKFALTDPKISRAIYEMGEGLLGEYVRILKLCGRYAIETGEEEITLETLRNINFPIPSVRRDDSNLGE